MKHLFCALTLVAFLAISFLGGCAKTPSMEIKNAAGSGSYVIDQTNAVFTDRLVEDGGINIRKKDDTPPPPQQEEQEESDDN